MNLVTRIGSAQAVLFDLFHTLFSFKSAATAGRSTSDILGIPEPIWDALLFESSEERLRGWESEKYAIMRRLVHRFDPRAPEGQIREAADAREARFRAGLTGDNAASVAVLAALKTSGKKLGLVSNADAIEVAGWGDSPLAPHFDATVFSFQVGFVKPEPEIYRIALDALGVAAAEAVFVGDGSSDELRGAREFGMTTVMTTEIVGRLWPEKIEARARHADYVIDKLDALVANPFDA